MIEKFSILPMVNHLAVQNLKGVLQNPIHHPEGDSFVHTIHVVCEMENICQRENIVGKRYQILMCAALLHDIGKFYTTKADFTAHGHEDVSAEMCPEILKYFGITFGIEYVQILVKLHMTRNFGDFSKFFKKLKFSKMLAENLCFLIEADHSGRPPLPKGMPLFAKEFLGFTKTFQKPKKQKEIPKVLGGKDLIGMGFKPSPKFSQFFEIVEKNNFDKAKAIEFAKEFFK